MTDTYDDDPRCTRCGTYRSEHAGIGCMDGFTTERPAPIIMTMEEYRALHWDDDDRDYYDVIDDTWDGNANTPDEDDQ